MGNKISKLNGCSEPDKKDSLCYSIDKWFEENCHEPRLCPLYVYERGLNKVTVPFTHIFTQIIQKLALSNKIHQLSTHEMLIPTRFISTASLWHTSYMLVHVCSFAIAGMGLGRIAALHVLASRKCHDQIGPILLQLLNLNRYEAYAAAI